MFSNDVTCFRTFHRTLINHFLFTFAFWSWILNVLFLGREKTFPRCLPSYFDWHVDSFLSLDLFQRASFLSLIERALARTVY
jgi:hypothetical protein